MNKSFVLGIWIVAVVVLVATFIQRGKAPHIASANTEQVTPSSVLPPVSSGRITNRNPRVSSASKVPEAAATLKLATDKSGRYRDRVDALNALPDALDKKQISELRAVIKNKHEAPTVRNDAVLALLRQRDYPLDLSKDLIRAWKDTDENPVWRDYVLQHLFNVYQKSAHKKEIEDVLLAAAKTPRTDKYNFGGTALLSLQQLSQGNPALAKKTTAIARRLILSDQTDPEQVITALQIARENGDTTVLPRARALAAGKEGLPRRKLAAIGFLGSLGQKSDLRLLKTLSKNSDRTVVRVAKHNLKQLQARLVNKT